MMALGKNESAKQMQLCTKQIETITLTYVIWQEMVLLFPLLFDIFEACVSAQLVLTVTPHSFFLLLVDIRYES